MQGQLQRRSELTGAVAENSAAWGISLPATVVLLVAPLAVALAALLASTLVPAAFILLTNEDGPLEWLQVLILLAAAVLFALAAIRLWHQPARRVAILFVIASLGALGVAGEEISWGQRIFGFATPEELGEINYQDELNLHNIAVLDNLVKLTHFAAGLYGSMLPVLALNRRVPRVLRSSILVPPVALTSFFLVTLVHWIGRIFVDPDRAGARVSEVSEISMFLGAAIYAWLCIRRLRTGAGAGDQRASNNRSPRPMTSD